LSGSFTGELYIWTGNSVKNSFKLHDAPLEAICVGSNSVLTGGRDGKVNVLSPNNYSLIFSFSMADAMF
jgi:hypothetical protein